MNNLFFCILLIASCRTQSHTNDANDATQAVDNNVVDGAPLKITTVVDGASVVSEGSALADSGDAVQDESICDIGVSKSFFEKLTIKMKSGSGKLNEPFVLQCTNAEKHTSFEIYCDEKQRIMQKRDSNDYLEITKDELESKCDLPNNIAYLKENFIPFRELNETSITGTGQPKDPFVVKCKNGLTLSKGLTDRILLIWDKSNGGTLKVSKYPFKGGLFSPYLEFRNLKLNEYNYVEELTCKNNSRLFINRVSIFRGIFIPDRNLNPEDITGTGQRKDPIVLKCVKNHFLPHLHNFNTIQLHFGYGVELLDFTLEKTNPKRSYQIELYYKEDVGLQDDFTCQPEPVGNNALQKCDLTSFQNTKITTYGMQQIPSSEDTKYYISCVENTEEIAVYCKTTDNIVEKNKDGEDSPIDAKEIERRCNVFTNIEYLKNHFTPGRNLHPYKITGSGQPKDPFVLKCIEGYTLPEMNNYNTIQLLLEENVWSLLDFTFKKTNSKRSSTVEIGPKIKTVGDRFTCEVAPNSGQPEELQMCDIGNYDNTNSKTYGTEQIRKNVIFYVSCAKNSQEFGISCKDNGKLMDTRYGLTEKEISSEIIEKRCIICPLKDLWQKILPMNLVLSPREAEKYLLKCRVNYAKIADKRDLEAKCSDEGEWEVYQLDTGIKVEFDNLYCERKGCNGYEFSGKSSYNESIVTNYTMAVDLKNDGTEVPIEVIHLE